MKENYFIIHGSFGSPFSNWFPWLADVKKYCNDVICFYSDNDPYVKYDTEKEFANMISTEQILIPNGGHINLESGYDTFEEIVEYLY